MKWLYLLVDPRTKEARWVGQSSRPWDRLNWHCSRARWDNDQLRAWIEELRSLGIRPELRVLAALEDTQADSTEEKLTVRLRDRGVPLLNIDSGRSRSEETRRRIGENCSWKGKIRPVEECQRMSDGQSRSWTPDRHMRYDETIRLRREGKA